MVQVESLHHRSVRKAIIVALFFILPQRLTVTTVKGSLVLLYKLNLSSNFGSY